MRFWIWRCVYNFTPHLGSILQLDSAMDAFLAMQKDAKGFIVHMEAAKPWLPFVLLVILHHSAIRWLLVRPP